MHSNDTQRVIVELNEFLESKHPSSVLQFITGVMVEWTNHEHSKQSGKFEINLAWRKYLNSLRNSIDGRLSFISTQSNSAAGSKRKALRIPQHVYEKGKVNEIASLLEGMSPDEAIDFIVEVTINWSFSIPINFLSLLPVTLNEESDEAIAKAIYTWLVRYNDLWP